MASPQVVDFEKRKNGMERGYIKLWRKIMDHDLYNEDRPKTRLEAWIDILLLARGTDSGEIKRGELKISTRDLAKRWQWSRPKVRRFLQYLKREHMVANVDPSLMNPTPSRTPDTDIVPIHQPTHPPFHVKVDRYESYNEGRSTPRYNNRPALYKEKEGKRRLKEEKLLGASRPPQKKSQGKKTPAPEQFIITDSLKEWASKAVPTVDIDSETDIFLDHHRSTGSVFANWDAAWRKWMLNALKFSQRDSRSRARRNDGTKPPEPDTEKVKREVYAASCMCEVSKRLVVTETQSQLWSEIVNKIGKKKPQLCDTWLKPCRYIGEHAGEPFVLVPNEVFRGFLSENFSRFSEVHFHFATLSEISALLLLPDYAHWSETQRVAT